MDYLFNLVCFDFEGFEVFVAKVAAVVAITIGTIAINYYCWA